MYRHLFGPVPSRRLGRSLGLDIVPGKTCSFDCVFCEVGATTILTLERREYVPVPEVMAEFEAWLGGGGQADHVTLAGSGEPTLHSRFGDVLQGVRERCRIPTVLLSNGTLFHLPEVRAAAARADIVKVSLSAWDPDSFRAVNRPHPGVRFPDVVEGYKAFRAAYGGILWLEVFLLDGVNAARPQVEKIARLAAGIRADRIHLNTAVRPGTEASVKAVRPEVLQELAGLFQPRADVADGGRPGAVLRAGGSGTEILAMISRRPCTAADIAAASGLRPEDVASALDRYLREGKVRSEPREGVVYYRAVPFPLPSGSDSGKMA